MALLQINQRLTLTGVQKKLSLSHAEKNPKGRLTIVGVDGRYILKPATEDYPEMPAVEHISMKLAEQLGLDVARCGLVYLADGELASLFQTLLFSYWIGNADMHLKNFSLWKDPIKGLIRMSPGYDYVSTRLLIPQNEDREELALPINGKKNKLKWQDFETLAQNLKIPLKVANNLKEKMLDFYPEAESLIYQSFLREETMEQFVSLISERSKKLEATS